MFTVAIITAVLAVLYGLIWHDQPAKQPDTMRLLDRR